MQSSSGTLYFDPWEITGMTVAPELNDGEDYHIFISYSSTDSDWACALIQELESAIPNLKACYHERDFLPGKTIVENMSMAIQRSQKVLLVLSEDFVRSRWCLMEANLSVFQENMCGKPVIPLMREHCSIPLHLTHLTYLDTKDKDFFAKLVSLICSSNQSMQTATLVPYQPLSLYNGKRLVCLSALNKDKLGKYDGSTFSENIPYELRMLCDDEVYRKAVHIINKTSSRNVRARHAASTVAAFIAGFCFVVFLCFAVLVKTCSPPSMCRFTLSNTGAMFALGATSTTFCMYLRYVTGKGRLKQISRAAGYANSLLVKHSIFIGCESRLKLHFLYISLNKCKEEFMKTFNSDPELAEEMFQRNLHYYSSSYTLCVAQNHFPFAYFNLKAGHMGNVPCFCEYVSYCLQEEKRKTCCTLVLSKYCLDLEMPAVGWHNDIYVL